MVQILPEVPSFGASFARNLGQGFSQGIGKAGDYAQKILGERRKAKELKDLFSSSGQSEGEGGEGGTPNHGQPIWSDLSFDKQVLLASKHPEIAKMMQANEDLASKKEGISLKNKKLTQEIQEKENEENSFRTGIKQVSELIEPGENEYFGKHGAIWNGGQKAFGIGPEGREQKERLDKQGLSLADKAYIKNNKGTLTDAKIEEFIKPLAPNSELSVAVNRARIKGLQTLYGLPEGIPEGKWNTIVKKEIKKVQAVEKSEEKKKGKQKPSLEDFWE